MRQTGLLSVTFRKLAPEKIIELTSQAGLDGIEWGGDIHVQPGDLENADKIRQATLEAGLINFAYGSYYRANCEPEMIAETAAALGVQWIRIWAGTLGSADCPPDVRRQTVEYLQKLCRKCAKGIQVAAEWHCRTLADNVTSAKKLLDEVGEDNFFSYFQREVRPNVREDNLNDLLAMPQNKLRALHVHYCCGSERLPLADGFEDWQELLAHVPEHIPALLEFVRNDSIEQFFEDAETLKRLVGNQTH